MAKNTKVISLSVKPDMHGILKRVAFEQGHGVMSTVACQLIEDFLPIDSNTYGILKDAAVKRGVKVSDLVEYLVSRFPLDDDTVKPIVLKIPIGVAQNKELLQNWLSQKTVALVAHLHPE